MARKDPFRRFSVLERICLALERKRGEEFADKPRVPPLNAYVEDVLWDFATGKLNRGGLERGAAADLTGVSKITGHARGAPPAPAESEHIDLQQKKGAGKKHHYQGGK